MKNIKPFDPASQVFLFCHVPKCGGTTLHDYLERAMDGSYVHCRPGSGWEERIGTVHGAGGHQVKDQNPIASRPGKEVVRLIVMREPLKRFQSFYRHIQDHPNHYIARRPGVREMSLSRFAAYCVEEQISEFDNLQSKYVVGLKGDHTNLAEVIETFQRDFRFYAPVEMMPYLFQRLDAFFGKQSEDTRTASRNISTPVDIDPDDLRRAADIVYSANYNDLQLYLACTQRFVQDAAA